MPVEHVVDCSKQRSDSYATDQEVTDEEVAWREPPEELAKPAVEARNLRKREALTRLHLSALTDPDLADLLIVLGLDDQ